MDRIKELETLLKSEDCGVLVEKCEDGQYEVDLWCFASGNMIGFYKGPDLVDILTQCVESLGLTATKREGE